MTKTDDKLYAWLRNGADEKLLKASSSAGTMLRRNSRIIASAPRGQLLQLQQTTAGEQLGAL